MIKPILQRLLVVSVIIYYLLQGGFDLSDICLFVYLSVCLLATFT